MIGFIRRRIKLRARWKEYVVTILLWMALAVVTGYIIFLLFPEQTARWKRTAEEVMQKTVAKIEADIQSGESKLTAYVSSDKVEASILDRLTPIVSYIEKNQQKILGNSETATSNIEQSSSAPSLQTSTASVAESSQSTTALSENSQTTQTTTLASTESTSEAAVESSAAAVTGNAQVIVPQIANLISTGKFLESQIRDYNYLLNTFYVVDKGTSLPQEILNPSALLSKNMSLQGDRSNLSYAFSGSICRFCAWGTITDNCRNGRLFDRTVDQYVWLSSNPSYGGL